MLAVQHEEINNNLSFGKFLKVKGSKKHIHHLKRKFAESYDEVLLISRKKTHKDSVLYIFSKKDVDKFLELTKKISFVKLKNNIEKYMPSKPKLLNIKRAEKLLEK